MLSDKQGNTAAYLLYTYTRIHSIIRMSGKDIDELKKTGKIALDLADERALGLGLVQFPELQHIFQTAEEACTKLLPNLLCEYLYNLSELCTKFYTSCKVNGSVEETSRLLLCEATATVMVKCFHLLGITPVYKM
uniref:arginine--tRNA ligase n=1 Tax=Brassica oleracea var. oleracea TaxID=109376 RepID=A0A0D3DHP5_BRAOL